MLLAGALGLGLSALTRVLGAFHNGDTDLQGKRFTVISKGENANGMRPFLTTQNTHAILQHQAKVATALRAILLKTSTAI